MTAPISVSYEGAVEALGLKSDWTIREAVRAGELSPRYLNSKTPLFDYEELKAWFKRAPIDKPAVKS